MTFAIERGIPMPKKKNSQPIYPFATMEIGDSFRASEINSVRVAAVNYSKRHGGKFITRAVPGGVRVWRTA